MPPKKGACWTYDIRLEDVARTYPPLPELTKWEPKYEGPVLAIGRAIYQAQPQDSVDNLVKIADALAREFPPGNIWWLPTYERLPYPYGVYWPLACAFRWEKTQKRRFEWYLWFDDDVLFTPNDIITLRKAAGEHKTPFIAACPYDRLPPHSPSVSEIGQDGKPWKWMIAPKSGSYPCFTVGLCLALFHRSLFDVVPEPWFGTIPPSLGYSGVAPDWWWCFQMHNAGLTPWVCCDTNVVHLARKVRIDRHVSENFLANSSLDEYEELKPEHRLISPTTGAVYHPPMATKDGRTEKPLEKLEMTPVCPPPVKP